MSGTKPMRMGYHGPGVSADAGVGYSAAFARRGFGYSNLVGKFLDPVSISPNARGQRMRRARIMWAKIQRGELSASAAGCGATTPRSSRSWDTHDERSLHKIRRSLCV